MSALPPPGPELAARNRRIIAERTGWPEGALEECERLEAEHPGYSVSWFPENKIGDPAWHQDAGFYAWMSGANPGHLVYPASGQQYVKRREWYGASAAELEKQLG